jgi:phospho-N-acetylmuramoyl-pentapeptide-transferase
MLYWLYELHPVFARFKYITFVLSLLLGPLIISLMKRCKVIEDVKKTDSQVLSKKRSEDKKDVPTMGGVFIVSAVVVACLLFAKLDNPFVLICLSVLVSAGILGFVDDYIKLTTGRKGMSIRGKLLGQTAIGLSVGFLLYFFFRETPGVFPDGLKLYVPLFKVSISMGLAYPFFAALVIVASSNAVNITDGLDGLAIGCTIFAAFAYAVISYIVGRHDYTGYLHVPYMPGAGELAVLCTAIIAAGLGFLWFNCHPAQIFMGNTGALPLGATIGVIALICKQELVLFVVGAIFVIETLSVIIQIISFRFWRKRVFRCAPIHHHFEEPFGTLKEVKVTVRFWIIAAILALLSVATLKIG